MQHKNHVEQKTGKALLLAKKIFKRSILRCAKSPKNGNTSWVPRYKPILCGMGPTALQPLPALASPHTSHIALLQVPRLVRVTWGETTAWDLSMLGASDVASSDMRSCTAAIPKLQDNIMHNG